MARLTTLLFAMWLGVTVSTVVDLEKRIYGGKDCEPAERQYHVQLKTTVEKAFKCGGSLISKEWVLTAAHCFKPKRTFTAHIGGNPGRPTEVEIKEKPVIFTDVDGKEHDLMLLKLLHPVDIDPVELPDCQDRPKNVKVQVAGHGATTAGPKNEKLSRSSPTLQCADMNIVDCQDEAVQHNQWICYSAPGVDTCPGDSGGGVVYKDKIYGVHKRSGKTYVCSKTAKFMDLCHQPYLKWIKDTIKKP